MRVRRQSSRGMRPIACSRCACFSAVKPGPICARAFARSAVVVAVVAGPVRFVMAPHKARSVRASVVSRAGCRPGVEFGREFACVDESHPVLEPLGGACPVGASCWRVGLGFVWRAPAM